MRSLLASGCFLAVWLGVALSGPVNDKEFFWFPNDNGVVVPALLKGGPAIADIKAVEDDVEFWHYLAGETAGRNITPGCTGCTASFVQGAPLVLLAHGFSSDHVGGFGNQLREAFQQRAEAVNLVFINWSKLAAAPWYETAANNVKPVGEYTARLLNFLVAEGVATLDQTYFVGHSLGSHVANHVALNLSGGKMATIFAMDPALPLFGVKPDEERIDPTDARFVNVFHTSMGTLADGGLAFEEPRGHADFYPNSGKDQPGCPGFDFGACSHSRSYAYLAESISRPRAFPSCECNSWEEYNSGICACSEQRSVLMGWETPATTQGIFYLKTNAQSPYGHGSS